jgi:DNA-binding IclR family transcriptional regulator
VLTVNWLARPVPLHATSTGKAWLAWLPEQEARSVLGPVLEGFTDATVTDVSRLLRELGQIRERGYAVSAGELEPALCGVSAPVLRPGDARPLAVFSIWGYADRMPPSRFTALGAVAIEAAASVEVTLRE